MNQFLDASKVYLAMLTVSIRAQMQYRVSFLFDSLGQLVLSSLDFIGMWVLLTRFGQIVGWRFAEIALLFGLTTCSFALAEGTSYGFDYFGAIVKRGDFDRMLLRPRSTVLQLAGQQLSLRRGAKLLQGMIVTAWALHHLEVLWDLRHVVTLLLTVAGGFGLYYGLFIFQATIIFWTIESLEIINILTYGGREVSQFPVTVYGAWLRRFFTFVVPVACVSYFPVCAFLGKTEVLGTSLLFQIMSPLLGLVFLAAMLLFWDHGEKRYRSTGS